MSMTISSFQPYRISEESYCSPWDLKIQEDKFKSLNEHRQTSTETLIHPSTSTNPFHQTHSITTKKSLIHHQPFPPVLPPLPFGGLISSTHSDSSSKNNTRNRTNSIFENRDPSRSISRSPSRQTISASFEPSLFVKDYNKPMSCETALLRFKHLNASTRNMSIPWQDIQTMYEQPWNTRFVNRLSSTNNRSRGSLQKISSIEKTKQYCPSLPFPIVSSCRHGKTEEFNNDTIDRYFWYHYSMSRRQAENVLQSRPLGSFLVRHSESGNQNDYSLSIRTINGCMHMRICYSAGVYILGECSRPFPSVSRMIEYFSQTSVPVHGAAHIKLGTPVSRWEILSLSLSNHCSEELL